MTEYQSVVSALFTDRHGQPVEDWIADQRDAGMSWRKVARGLYELTGGLVDVTPQTLINWTTRRETAA